MSAGNVRCGYRYLDTRQSSSINHGFYHSGEDVKGVYMSQEKSQYSYCNCGVYHRVDKSGDDGIVGYRSQYISHSSSHSCGSRFDVASRGGYMSQNRHSSSHNPGGCGRLSVLSFPYFPVDKHVHGDEKVGYSSHENKKGDMSGNYGEKKGDISVDDRRRGFRSQNTRHS